MINRICGMILLVLFMPLIILLGMAIAVCCGFPVIYHSHRFGVGKRKFIIYKFSTLRNWTPEEFREYLCAFPKLKREWDRYGKLRCDPRATLLGKILRRFSLDELPQLWNVVCGDMALVGPRPIIKDEEQLYGKYSDLLHSVKPGITGLWQVSGRNLITYHRRIAINLYYVKHKSWKLDLWILYKTVWAVIGGRGAF